MLRLPEGVTWVTVIGVAGVILGGFWVGGQVSERVRLLDNLERHSKSYPADAAVAQVLIGCNKRLIVNVEDCGAHLIKSFGTDVLERVATMQMLGAFGMPLGPDGKPLPLPDPALVRAQVTQAEPAAVAEPSIQWSPPKE